MAFVASTCALYIYIYVYIYIKYTYVNSRIYQSNVAFSRDPAKLTATWPFNLRCCQMLTKPFGCFRCSACGMYRE